MEKFMNLHELHYIRVLEDYDNVLFKEQVVFGKISRNNLYLIIAPYYDNEYIEPIKELQNNPLYPEKKFLVRIKLDNLKLDHMPTKKVSEEEFIKYICKDITRDEFYGYFEPNNGFEFDGKLDLKLDYLKRYLDKINEPSEITLEAFSLAIDYDTYLSKFVYSFDKNEDYFFENEKLLFTQFVGCMQKLRDEDYMYTLDDIKESVNEEIDYFKGLTKKRSKLVMSMFIEKHSQEANYYQFKEVPKLIDTYREYADILIGMNDKLAIKAKAYLDYEGAFFWPVDYKEAEELLLKLAKFGDDDAYNTLGYLYYYHMNSDKSNYEKAFHYFSIGAILNHAESKYKLADCLYYGQGCEKNEYVAYQIIDDLYYNQKNIFSNGNMIWKFADVSYRHALFHKYGCNNLANIKNEHLAKKNISESLYAINKRMETIDYIGDDLVFKDIIKVYNSFDFLKIKKEIDIDDEIYEDLINDLDINEDNLLCKLFSLKDNRIRLEIFFKTKLDRKILFTYTDYGKSYLHNKIVIEGYSNFDKTVKYFYKKSGLDFIKLSGFNTLVITVNSNVYFIQEPKIIVPNELIDKGKMHQIAAILLDDQKLSESMPFYFIADGFELKPNDRVLLDAPNGGYIEASVYKVLILYENELDYPISKYRSIVRKVEKFVN